MRTRYQCAHFRGHPLCRHALALTFSAFDGEVAYALGQAIRGHYYSLKAATGILISIRLFSGLTLFQAACGRNVNPTNEDWVRRKYNTGEQTCMCGRAAV